MAVALVSFMAAFTACGGGNKSAEKAEEVEAVETPVVIEEALEVVEGDSLTVEAEEIVVEEVVAE